MLVWYPTPAQPAIPAMEAWIDDGDGFACCVGTFFYQRLTGDAALRAIWRDFDGSNSARPPDALGNYLIAVGKQGRIWVFGDRLGLIRLYQAPGLGLLSTSWLACLDAMSAPVLDPFGTREYIFEGANHGDRSPVAGIGIADPDVVTEVTTGTIQTRARLADWLTAPAQASAADAVDDLANKLTENAEIMANAFRGRVRCALSGGFDSRLLVATLLKVGAKPDLYVYGSHADADVRIAQRCADAVGLPLRWVDKQQMDEDQADSDQPPAKLATLDESRLHANIDFFDGLPIDGILDTGSDRQTRLMQSADGYLALNGGGGEILRNFYYLRGQRYTARQIEQTFYRGYPSKAFLRKSDLAHYRERMTASIERIVGADLLDRRRVDLIYPLFRNRYWAGRNNSMAVRTGHFLTPLLEMDLVRAAIATPVSWRDFGRLESKLIAKLEPRLGGVPLSYGFRPDRGPDWRYRGKMYLQQLRPPWLRGQSANIRDLLCRNRIDLDGTSGTCKGEAVTDRVLATRALRKEAQRSRVLTIEALLRRYRIDVESN